MDLNVGVLLVGLVFGAFPQLAVFAFGDNRPSALFAAAVVASLAGGVLSAYALTLGPFAPIDRAFNDPYFTIVTVARSTLVRTGMLLICWLIVWGIERFDVMLFPHFIKASFWVGYLALLGLQVIPATLPIRRRYLDDFEIINSINTLLVYMVLTSFSSLILASLWCLKRKYHDR